MKSKPDNRPSPSPPGAPTRNYNVTEHARVDEGWFSRWVGSGDVRLINGAI